MMILALRDAFDEDTESLAFREKRVSTNQAIIVFCSDLELEQRHLHVDMTLEQAREKSPSSRSSNGKWLTRSPALGNYS